MKWNGKKIVYDLCAGTGAWSKPYAGNPDEYDVRGITLPANDVRSFIPDHEEKVYGVLAAPPCDCFAASGAQYWKQKDTDGRTLEALSIVDACIRFIFIVDPVFWVLENPVGRLRYWIGPPRMYYNPCDYGDPYTKKTCLWGKYNEPAKNPVDPIRVCKQGSWVQHLGGSSENTKRLRSIAPPGFVRAFYGANR